MELAIRRNERHTAQRREDRDVRLTEIARIHRHGPGDLAGLSQHLSQHGLGLLLVIGFIGDISSDNDLGPRVDGRLAVEPLHHTPLGI